MQSPHPEVVFVKALHLKPCNFTGELFSLNFYTENPATSQVLSRSLIRNRDSDGKQQERTTKCNIIAVIAQT